MPTTIRSALVLLAGVALFVLVATVSNLARIPHPVWMWPAAIILIPLAGWAATSLIARSKRVEVAA